MGFTTIFEAPGLPPLARRRARAAGPRAVAMRSDHHRLLRSARFVDVTELDVTPAFRVTAAAWLAESEAHATELAMLEPPGAFQQRLADRRAMLTAIDAGLLRRTLVFARRKASALSGRAVELPEGRRPGPGGPARGPDRGRAGRHPARR
jgi:hypothetical protein